MTLTSIVVLAVAGLAAGTVNALAGGGSLISFPALLGTGLSSVAANVTNTAALWPGYLTSTAGYRAELLKMRHELRLAATAGAIGAVAGATILLTTPTRIFASLVPWMVLLGTALFAIQPLVSRRVKQHAAIDRGDMIGWPTLVAITGAAVYGGYFGAGLGVMLLGILGIFLTANLQELNALKNLLSLIVNTVALIAFALFGPVHWADVLVLSVASSVGGYAGAIGARRMPQKALRIFVTLLGVGVTVTLFAT